VELLARAVKDILADTNPSGVLHHIISKRKAPGLAFYVAFLDGLMKELFCEMRPAFMSYLQTGNWESIERATEAGYCNARKYAKIMIDIFQTGMKQENPQWVQQQIECALLGHIKGLGTNTRQ
jgi:hypothetical protein